MSTRSTRLIRGPFHIFWDVVERAYFIDMGRGTYNRAWRIWPPPLGRRLY